MKQSRICNTLIIENFSELTHYTFNWIKGKNYEYKNKAALYQGKRIPVGKNQANAARQ
ncbi:MAG: hypothetical protein KAQ69_10095 [Spirochaetales bacterium]|nr:hypothetical protein [Spirochaetales bacterium]